MIVDTSILLSIVFDEEHGAWSEDVLARHSRDLKMSTINLTELLILLKRRRPGTEEEVKGLLYKKPISFFDATRAHAETAATARVMYKDLNFGDCFAYALAKEHACPIITLDADFLKTDLEVIHPTK